MLWNRLQGAGGLVGGGGEWFSRTVYSSERIDSIATDPTGNVVVAGNFSYANRALVAKANASGVFQWYKFLSVEPINYFKSVATNVSGDIFAVGYTFNSASSINYGLLAKYDQSGALQWVRALSAYPAFAYLIGVAVDSGGNIVVCGQVSSGAYTLLAKYDPTGALLWYTTETISSSTIIYNYVAIDSADNIILCGDGRLSGQNRMVVAKYDPNGTVLWSTSLPGLLFSFSCCVDANDDIYIASLDYSYYGVYAGILSKFSSSGVQQWVRAQYIPSLNTGGFYGVASDTTGNVYVSGRMSYPNPGGRSSAQSISKYSSSGTLLWDHVVSTNSPETFGPRVTADRRGTPIFVVPDRVVTSDGLCVCKVPADGSGLGIYTSPSGNFETIYYDNPMAPYLTTYATPSITATPITLSSVAFTITSTAPTFTDTSYTPTNEEVIII